MTAEAWMTGEASEAAVAVGVLERYLRRERTVQRWLWVRVGAV